MKTSRNEITKRLNYAFEDKRLNKEQVAREMSTCVQNLNRYLRGARVPNNEWLFKFHRLYDVDIMWLLFGKNEIKETEINQILIMIDPKIIYDYITHYKEPKEIAEYRKESNISFKIMRSYTKEWFGKTIGVYD